jgi:hypothetical protein
MKEFSKLSLTDRARRPQKDQEADSQNKTNKAEHSHALDTPKRKLFTLIKGIHEGGAAVGNTYSQFKTLTKRLSQTEKLPDSNSITKLGKVADSQGGQMKYEHLTIKPKSRDKNPHKLK